MKTIRSLQALAGLVALLMFGAGHVYAAPPWINQGPPVWCYGLNEFDQCVLFLGTETTCMNVAPCLSVGVSPTGEDLHFCFGANAFDQCQLFLGTAEQCDNVDPCIGGVGMFPRAPRFRAAD